MLFVFLVSQVFYDHGYLWIPWLAMRVFILCLSAMKILLPETYQEVNKHDNKRVI